MLEHSPKQAPERHPDDLPVVPGNDRFGDFVVARKNLYDKDNPPDTFDLEITAQAARKMFDDQNEQIRLIDLDREREAYKARHDPLTGLLNRRGLQEAYEELFSSPDEYFAKRPDSQAKNEHRRRMDEPGQRPSSHMIVAIDLDNFKGANDEHGHPLGDKVLVVITEALQGFLRKSDILARTGGDEFVVVLPYADEKMAAKMIERMRVFVENFKELEGKRLNLGISAGITKAGPHFGASYHDADKKTYEAKRKGKNQVVV